MQGFDEFPQPLSRDDIVLLEKEWARLQRGHRALQSALHHYVKERDRNKAQVLQLQTKMVQEQQETTSATCEHQHEESDASQGGGRKRDRDDGEREDVAAAVVDPSSSSSSSTAVAIKHQTESVTPMPPAGARKRFQSSGLLAGLKKMMDLNQKQDAAAGRGDTIRQERERIAREARQSILNADLAVLQSNYSKSDQAVLELTEKISLLKPKMDEINKLVLSVDANEAMYCSAFYLKALGGAHATGCSPAEESEPPQEGLGNNKAEKSISTITQRSAAPYDVYFVPAVHSDATREAVRGQVYEVLDVYVTWRSEVDPVIASLRQARGERQESQQVLVEDVAGVFAAVPPLPPPPRAPPLSSSAVAAALPSYDSLAVEQARADITRPSEVEMAVYQQALAALDEFE